METTKRCPHCGAALPDGSIYCYKCGTKVEMPVQNDIRDYSKLNDTPVTSAQDQNIPIDDLLGQTHVINSLMSELDDIVKGTGTDDTPVTPSVSEVPVEKPTFTRSNPSAKEEKASRLENTDPFAWEIPAFKAPSSINTNEQKETDTLETSYSEPKLKEEYAIEEEKKPLSRSSRHKHVVTDPYVNDTSEFSDPEEEEEEKTTIKKNKPKKKSFLFEEEEEDDEDSYEDEDYEEDDEKHIWPIILGVLLILIVGGSILLVIFKPDTVNKGIDGFNNIFHTEIKHLGATEEPVETPEPTMTPSATVDTTVYDAEHTLFSTVSHLYSSFYKDYIDAYNSGDIQSLNHVTDSLKAEIQDRYTNYNSGLGFEARFTYIDLNSYVISDLQEDGYYNISFNTYQENRCWDKETNEEKDNNPTMAISMRYNPETGDYYLSSMKIDGSIALGNQMIDVTSW